MRIVEFDDKGRRVEADKNSVTLTERGSALAPRPGKVHSATTPEAAPMRRKSAGGVDLQMFQSGTIRTATKRIKMHGGEATIEIPVPWYLVRHPKGNVLIDGGSAIEAAIDPRGHWGSAVDDYQLTMDVSENCVDQLKAAGVRPEDIRFVVQSHLHLDHTGAIGRFPRATYIVQRAEYEYAKKPHWFAEGAYCRADFDRPGLNWKFLGGDYTDNYDLFGDGVVRMIFTPGHSPGHQSFLISLPKTGPVLLTIDAAYTMDHWEEKAMPGLVVSSGKAADSVRKLRRIASDTGAMVVTGHDPVLWAGMRKAPNDFYD